MECEDFSFLTGDDKGYGGVGTKDIPEDIAEEGESSGESVKDEEGKENVDHTT